MSVLGPRKSSKKKRKSNSFYATPQVITLDDESEVSTLDLTGVGEGEEEVIILEESIINSGRQTRQRSSSNISVVNSTDISENKTISKRKGAVVNRKIENVKIVTPTFSSEIQVINNWSVPKMSKKQTRNLKRKRKSLTRTISNSTKSESLSSPSSNVSTPRKKRKLQDISNIRSGSLSIASPSFTQPSNLSENTLKYYENISKVVGKNRKEGKGSSFRSNVPIMNHFDNNKKRLNQSLNKKVSPIRVCLEANKKRRIITPQNNSRPRDPHSLINRFDHKSFNFHNSPRRSIRKIHQEVRKAIGYTNSFNPNPFEVDLEGLRPIVIDGCNVAIGHGKGKFSPKGLQICVDYFAATGHNKIKLFLPQFRQEEFAAELLETLKAKCDVVFTPSQCINGQRRTSYDDRFIVQYATEFGGVIVSTDNFRDISKENPRWQDTIAKRLLMFTWVDDFLMFPVDPLGRSGPTLEEFLRF